MWVRFSAENLQKIAEELLPNGEETAILEYVDIIRRGGTPLTGRRQRKKARRSLLCRAALGLYRALVIVSAVIVVGYGAYKLFVRPPQVEAPPVVEQPGGDVSSGGQEMPPELERKKQCYTFLLMGTDDGNGNADTLMVASYDVKAGTVGVVSIPRDTIVDRSWSRYPKINGAYGGGGGVKRVREEVSHLLGIPIDYYVKVDIKAFVALVDEVGGVDFDVPVNMDYDDPWQNLSIHYKKGMQHLSGQQALEVVRFRHNNDMTGYSDVGRTQTQQKLLTAVAKKVLSWGSIAKIKPFLDIFNQYVDTDLDAGDILFFATQALYINMDSGINTKTLTGRGDATHNGYTWCYELDREQTLADINDLLNPYTTPVTDEMAHIISANG